MKKEFSYEIWKQLPSGKVRDRYETLDGNLVLEATNRVSAFDEVLGEIPGKGSVVTKMSEFWFNQTSDIIPNHMIEVLNPTMMVCKKLTPIPVEVVVRGYMTGVTGTSIWGSYEKGEREIYGIQFRDGYKKNDQLDKLIITPTTKAQAGHDERLTEKEIVDRGIVQADTWEQIRTAALAMFTRAQDIARKKGFILVDTKMEFGTDENGTVYVMDELFTPDSSRYWRDNTVGWGGEPVHYDKEYLRIELKRLKEKGVWKEGEPIPDYIIQETARRYQVVCEAIISEEEKTTPRVIVIMGSDADLHHAKTIRDYIVGSQVDCEMHVASAHKTPRYLLDMLEQYRSENRPTVYIAVAGGSNALAAEIAGEVHDSRVISCPPPGTEWVDIYSSMHNPSGISVATILGAEAAALDALKSFAMFDPELAEKLAADAQLLQKKIYAADKRIEKLYN